MNIEKALREYREKKARIAILELELEGLKEELKLSTGFTETDEETILGMTFKRDISSNNVSSGNNSSKTERVAIKYKNEQDKLRSPKSLDKIYEQIRQKDGEKKRLQEEIQPIKIAIAGLSEKERLIIDEKYIENNSWYIVGQRYKERFGVYIAERTCKNIKQEAFDRLKRILGV